MATLLNTGLTEEQLAASLRMIEAGANPDALAVSFLSNRTEIRLMECEQSAIQLLRSKGVAK